MDAQEILIASGISAAAVLALVNLFPSVFTHILSRDLESHRYTLELLKNKDSKLYDERAKVVKQLYEKMVYIESHLKSFEIFRGDLEKKMRYLEIFVNQFSDFQITFKMNRLYFPERICTKIEELIENIHKLNGNMFWIDEFTKKELLDKLTEEEKKNNKAMYEIMKKWFDEANERIPPIKREVEKEFRKYLGVA